LTVRFLIGLAGFCLASVSAHGQAKQSSVRFLNLAYKSATMADGGHTTSAIQPGDVSGFVLVPSGAQTVHLKCGIYDSVLKANLGAGESATVVLCVDGFHAGIIGRDQKGASGDRNFTVGSIKSDGGPDSQWGPVLVEQGGDSHKLSRSVPSCVLSAGPWKISGGGIMSPPALKVKSNRVYTLVLVRYGSGQYSANLLEAATGSK
jgi:hypothetical protein